MAKKRIKLIQECREAMPKKVRLMGLDVGTKTIGIAISDADQSIATPVGTIKRIKFGADVDALLQIIKEFEVKGIVMGWPVEMDGAAGKRCDMVMSFADELSRHEGLHKALGNPPFIALQDERLSTQAVDEFVQNRVDMGKKSKKGAKEKGLTDALAAQIILQTALDGI